MTALSNALRVTVERAIARKLVTGMLEAGIAQIDVDGYPPGPKSLQELLDQMFNLDECHISFAPPNARSSWIFLVFGNGQDLISDYGVSLENAPWLRAALDFAEAIGDGKVEITIAERAP